MRDWEREREREREREKGVFDSSMNPGKDLINKLLSVIPMDI